MNKAVLTVEGYCPICESPQRFVARDLWLRDHLLCENCKSIPRERALMHLLQTLRPDWRDLLIHESSPGNAASDKLWRLCKRFTPSQYDLSTPFGQINHTTGCQSEDLQNQTFASEMFDIVVTQDVFEHIFDPGAAIREIARTLKPGGFHICTVPLVRQALPSRRRAKLQDGEIEHLEPAEYHVNPIDEKGSLVTVDWGWDIAEFFQFHSGLAATIYMLDRLDMGIRAELIEVLVAHKTGIVAL